MRGRSPHTPRGPALTSIAARLCLASIMTMLPTYTLGVSHVARVFVWGIYSSLFETFVTRHCGKLDLVKISLVHCTPASRAATPSTRHPATCANCAGEVTLHRGPLWW
jgi:hypothetical protein